MHPSSTSQILPVSFPQLLFFSKPKSLRKCCCSGSDEFPHMNAYPGPEVIRISQLLTLTASFSAPYSYPEVNFSSANVFPATERKLSSTMYIIFTSQGIQDLIAHPTPYMCDGIKTCKALPLYLFPNCSMKKKKK